MKKKSNNQKNRNVSVPWGRAASLHRPGIFIKRYLTKHGEACVADIYRELGEEIDRLNKERMAMGETPFRRPNYSSFSRYFHWFLILGLIERTARREPAIYDFLHDKVFYKLTRKGRAEVKAWDDPVRAAHPEFYGLLEQVEPEQAEGKQVENTGDPVCGACCRKHPNKAPEAPLLTNEQVLKS